MADRKTFQDFLTKLSREPSARNSYQDDPVGVMRAEGLSDSQMIAFLSQDTNKIQDELGSDVDAAFRVIVTIIVTVQF
jgi:hypothetical protein